MNALPKMSQSRKRKRKNHDGDDYIKTNHRTPDKRLHTSRKRRREELEDDYVPEPVVKRQRCSPASDELAIDCEMIQIKRRFTRKNEQILASVAIVDSSQPPQLVYYAICPPPGWNKDTLKSRLVIPMSRPFCPITDQEFQKAALEGVTIETVKSEVQDILEGKIVIGHAVRHDLSVLGLDALIPSDKIRDVQSHYTPARCAQLGLNNVGNGHQHSLQNLSKHVLGKSIQEGPHNAIEDATATMELYLYDKPNFRAVGDGGSSLLNFLRRKLADAKRERKRRQRERKSRRKAMKI